jgi:hypothetical protein
MKDSNVQIAGKKTPHLIKPAEITAENAFLAYT